MAIFGKSSLTRKYIMAFTGLFLCLFLVGHLIGNLQLLNLNQALARDSFNEYAVFMTTNPFIKIMSFLTYIGILYHVIEAIILTFHNYKARKIGYVVYKGNKSAKWNSRNMGILGTIILVFIVIHMGMFWREMHFGAMEIYTTAGGNEVKDLYSHTVKTFQDSSMGMFWASLYAVSMLAIGFHLYHGFASGFQSLGLRSAKYICAVTSIGKIFAVVVPLLFAIIPFYIYFFLDKL